MRTFLSHTRFFILWILGTFVALFGAIIVALLLFLVASLVWMAFVGSEAILINSRFVLVGAVIFFSIIGASIGLIFGQIQKSILRQHTGDPWRGWLIASSIGGIIGVDLVALLIGTQAGAYLAWFVLPPPDTLFWLGLQLTIGIFGCIGLIQMTVLWNHVHGAWVWVLANMTAGVVLIALLAAGTPGWAINPLLTLAAFALIFATPGMITGFAMTWLLATNRKYTY